MMRSGAKARQAQLARHMPAREDGALAVERR